MDMISKSLELVKKYFDGAVDKGGNPYINHILSVENGVTTKEEKVVALLHDIIEDTVITKGDLINMGYQNNIVESIDLVTRPENMSYEDFINRLAESENLVAINVKLSDLNNNMDLSRIPKYSEKDIYRVKYKYKPAYEKLQLVKNKLINEIRKND